MILILEKIYNILFKCIINKYLHIPTKHNLKCKL